MSIIEKYSFEIDDIKNIIKDLKAGRVYEITGARFDGSLNTNAQKLENAIADLLNKIENDKESINDKLNDLFL